MPFRRRIRALPAVLLLAGCFASSAVRGTDEAGRPTFRVGVDTVFVHVAVADAANRHVDDLTRENFHVFENSVEQTVTHFVREAAPVSVGVLLDASRSMKDNYRNARESVTRFLEPDAADDEFFVLSFNQRARLLQRFTRDPASVRKAVRSIRPRGRTAFFDAVRLGILEMAEARNPKKALILITDGDDNSSRHSAAEVRALARECPAQIYAIGERKGLSSGRAAIQSLADLTGGRAFFPESLAELDACIELIRAELSHEYVLGYVPAVKPSGREWRNVEVRLAGVEGRPKLTVRASRGYFTARR
jgi:Ca-activated chloride channel family protein